MYKYKQPPNKVKKTRIPIRNKLKTFTLKPFQNMKFIRKKCSRDVNKILLKAIMNL